MPVFSAESPLTCVALDPARRSMHFDDLTTAPRRTSLSGDWRAEHSRRLSEKVRYAG